MPKRLVSICIASIGRPSLLDTVDAALACTLPPGFAREIVVADDSRTATVASVLASRVDRTDVHVVTSAARNISIARNRAMAAASGEYVVFVDDDEVPAGDWLEQLVLLAETSGADGVQGCVIGIYPRHAPAWAKQLRPYDKTYGAAGQAIQVGSTCNLLLRRAALTERSLEFDPALGRTGGEDTDLCFRLTASGGRIVCSTTATVYENVPVERLAPRHLLRRYARGGHSYASTVLAHTGALRQVLEIGKAAVLAVTFSLIAFASWRIVPAAAMRFALRTSGNVGKLLFFLGRPAWNLY